MAGWQLGIDFGTSSTVAAAVEAGNATVLDLESNGRVRMSSAVFLTEEGDLLVGSAAEHQAVFAPERFEPTPKRLLGEGSVFLGDRMIPIADLVAAVLRRVYTEACRHQGERVPSALRLTHPAQWGGARLAVLADAAQRAGLPVAELVAEPVAAAARIAYAATEPGSRIAVYDFGGGTFDAAVLVRTDSGFEVAGPPAGRDPLGGVDIDQRIMDYLGEFLAGEQPEEWRLLRNPEDVAWRRDAASFRAEVQRAKETLSEVPACQLWVPGLDREVQLTRVELEQLIGDEVDATVDTLEVALQDADATPSDLAGLYLVGGSSRIPLVADTIWRRLQVRPLVQENPKSVVALGAAAWLPALRAPPGAPPLSPVASPPASPVPSPVPAPIPPAASPPPGSPTGSLRWPSDPPAVSPPPGGGPPPGTTSVRSALVMSLESDAWPAGCDCRAQLVLDRDGSPPLTLRLRNEPAVVHDAAQLAAQVLQMRAPRTPGFREIWLGPATVLATSVGFERRFTMDGPDGAVAMFEQYLVVGDRAFVLAGPEPARYLTDSLALGRPELPTAGWFEPRFDGVVPADWAVVEQVVLKRRGTRHQVTCTRATHPSPSAAAAWGTEQVNRLLALPGARLVGRVSAIVIGEVPGEIMTFAWTDRGGEMLTKLGLATVGRNGVAVLMALPPSDEALFPALAQHARLAPSGVTALSGSSSGSG